ncbi:hypothetical protein GCM10010371_69460 [Streptomyces subrutilus]|uniref:Uncharacterized protein n=1 Tax=Streptomyces subrutilus TaxID=36818 RepID=A0A918VJ38_9ACTN|nr:hypothetical protein GCM10010371_69460 [Streptomyces subrutilus]
MVKAFGEGTAVKAFARQHQVDLKTIRRVLDAAGARELPEQLEVLTDPAAEQQPEPDTVITLDLPGLLADHLLAGGDETVRAARLRPDHPPRPGPLPVDHRTARTPPHRAAAGRCPRHRHRQLRRAQGPPGLRRPHHGRNLIIRGLPLLTLKLFCRRG